MRRPPSVQRRPERAPGRPGRSKRAKRRRKSPEFLSRASLLSFIRFSPIARRPRASKASPIRHAKEPRRAAGPGSLIAAKGIACQIPAEKVRPTATIGVVIVIGVLTAAA